jgi:hypothetical protein
VHDIDYFVDLWPLHLLDPADYDHFERLVCDVMLCVRCVRGCDRTITIAPQYALLHFSPHCIEFYCDQVQSICWRACVSV